LLRYTRGYKCSVLKSLFDAQSASQILAAVGGVMQRLVKEKTAE
jgi:hypothetical protein